MHDRADDYLGKNYYYYWNQINIAEDIQWMWATVAVLDDKFDNIKVIEDKAVWGIRLLHSCIRSQTEYRELRGDQWVVECNIIEHRAIRAIGHEPKGNLKLNGFARFRLRDNIERDECHVVHVVVMHAVGILYLREWSRRIVGDGGCNILRT